jgi:predicted RNA-binding protein with EMAP domain
MTEQEIVERMLEVYTLMKKDYTHPYYYDDIKSKSLSTVIDLRKGKFEGLSDTQKIHLSNWVSNILNACELAILMREETFDAEELLKIKQNMLDLLEESHKNFKLIKNDQEQND